MAHVVVLGAGLGGTIMAFELRGKLGKEHQVSVVSNGGSFFFVPSNPWVAVGWRDRKAVEVELAPALASRNIALHPQGARRLDPASHRIELNDGGTVSYDYLVIATGPELAFDEIEGLGPHANTASGFTPPRSAPRNTSCTRSAPGTQSRSTSGSRCKRWGSTSSRRSGSELSPGPESRSSHAFGNEL